MASISRSRWADDEEESTEAIAQRKREKEEKRRAKEEKQRKLREEEEARVNAGAGATDAETEDGDTSGRPNKRRRRSIEENDRSEPTMLRFSAPPLASCGDVEKYERLNDIEEGSYGWVSRARDTRTGNVVALKKLKMDYANDGFPVTGLREIQTLKASRHANIVTLHEIVMGGTLKEYADFINHNPGPSLVGSGFLYNSVYLVMEFLSHDLKTLLDELPEPFLPSEVKTLMIQLTSGLSFLHSHWILHRDLKTSNLLINNRGELKIADFGMARYTSVPPPRNLTATVVTLWYRSPELLLGEPSYSFPIDMWSLGCIFGELLTNTPLFQGKNEVDQLSKIFSLLGPPDPKNWPEFRRLPNAKALHPVLSKISQKTSTLSQRFPPSISTPQTLALLTSLLSYNPSLRPTAADILDQHPYFVSEPPRPKPKEMFPTFPSKASGEQPRRRRHETPNAPVREDGVKRFGEEDVKGLFGGGGEDEMRGAGFSLRLG